MQLTSEQEEGRQTVSSTNTKAFQPTAVWIKIKTLLCDLVKLKVVLVTFLEQFTNGYRWGGGVDEI